MTPMTDRQIKRVLKRALNGEVMQWKRPDTEWKTDKDFFDVVDSARWALIQDGFQIRIQPKARKKS